MKTGRSLTELAQEIERQNNSKRDYVVSTSSLSLITNDPKTPPVMAMMGLAEHFSVNKHTHAQIGTHLDIPRKFYDNLLANHNDLLAHTVNTLFNRQSAPRMIRTLDGRARAFLSNRYRPIDNAEVAEVALSIFADAQAQMASCEVTESKMYLKALFPKTEGEVTKGDVVQMGVVIKNSEIGMGRFVVEPLIYRLVCLNGMIMQDGKIGRTHLGGRHGIDSEGLAIEYKHDTQRAMDRSLMLQVRDTIKALSTPEKMRYFVEKFQAAANNKIEGDVVAGVQVLQKKAALNDNDKGGILRHLISGGDLTQWGLANAVTRYSQDVDSYDHATSLEALGGEIIELAPSDWRAIATAAA